ncbi:MAG TPA: hypothetical protein VGN54_06720, partial [Mycobacteriales bacterium]|nr:hypothetical protein [Mycobacteriales bacterium]
NVFRYGQCNQQIGCSGPVLCRMISCTPPWHFENCTTDVATDNNTTDHSAPCLPSAYTAIQRRYDQLGGPGSVLGASIGPEYGVPGGSAQATVTGRLYDSAAGVFWLHGAILATFDARGGQQVFGLPTSDETGIIGGAYVSFTLRAWIISSSTGTWPVRGGTLDRWYADGRDRSAVGLPTGDPVAIAGGATVTRFQHGLITSGPPGSFSISAPIVAAYDRFGPLTFGAATGQATAVAGGHEQRFVRQAAIFAGGAGAFLVPGQILAAYDAHGGAAGVLGFPLADPVVSADRRATVSRFQSGAVVSSAAVGTHEVHGPIAATWQADGAEGGSLGLPVTDVQTGAGGVQFSDFEGGRLTYDPATGQVTRS